MRTALISLGLLAMLGGCEDKSLPKIVAASHVAENAPNRGVLWPILLQHCERNPTCDAAGKFGEGAGEASNIVGAVRYFAQSAEVVKEDGRDYGARITLSVIAPRGVGGQAGRPLTQDEAPSDLRAAKARESWLSIEYRTPPPTGDPKPYFLTFRSAQLALGVTGAASAKSRNEIKTLTEAEVSRWSWGKNNQDEAAKGAKIEISGKAGVLFSGYSIGLPANAELDNETALRQRYEPWIFYVSRNLREDGAGLAPLMQALQAGETLSLSISSPSGPILRDFIYASGYPDALKEAAAALKDTARIAEPITRRCQTYVGQGTAIWDELGPALADAPANHTCDPRSPEERNDAATRKTARPSAPAKPK